MGSNRRSRSRVSVLLVLLLAVTAACDSARPSPTTTPAVPDASDGPPAKVVGDLALAACDPEFLLPCEQQALVLVEPVAGTGLALTYSTEWADGRLDRPTWNAAALGLGGWSLDVIQRYDPERGILLAGGGSWRFAAAADLGNGERAVPSFDGFQAYVFDAAWRHVRTVDLITGATLLTVTYDAAGRVTGVAGDGGGSPVSLSVDRDGDGGLRYLVAPSDLRTSLNVDGAGRLAAIGRPDGTMLTVGYRDHGLVNSWQASGLGNFSYAWDDAGRLTKATDPDGVSIELTHAASDGSVTITARDANGGTTTFHAERASDAIARSFTDTDGTVTRLLTNADGSTRLTEADGTVTTAGAAAHPRWGMAAPIRTPVVETRPDGAEYRVETTTTMGAGTGALTAVAWETVTTAGGERWVDAFDPATRTVTRTDRAGRTGTQAFDAQGRPAARRMPGEAPASFTYDPAGVLASMTVGEGATAATTSYTYADNEVTELLPNGTTITTRLDPFGRVRRVTAPDEHAVTERDAAGSALQLRAGAHPPVSFGATEAGRRTAFLPPAVGDDDWYEILSYTAAGQLSTIGDANGPRVQLTYDSAGRTTSWAFDRGTSTATYDAQTGLLASNASPDGVTTTFSYAGWVPTGIAWSGPVRGEVRTTVDALLQGTGTSVDGGAALPFGYDDAGFLTSVGGARIERDPSTGMPVRATLGSVVTAWEYDASMRVASSSTTAGGKAVLTLRFQRDILGRITRVDRTDAAGAVTTTAFGYDATGRLTSWQRNETVTTYEYDASGNRLASVRGTNRTTATYDDRDRLVQLGAATYRHDPDGTLLERKGGDGTTTFDIDDLGDLRSVALPDGQRVEYVIDAGGRRIGRKVDGVLTDGYRYGLDDTLVGWTDGTGRLRAQLAYDDSGRLALVRLDGRELLVVTDQVGSPIALLDGATGDLVATAAYDAWGNVLDGGIAKVLPIGFAGGLADPATGLVHFGARDYDPAAGRWTAPDPLRYDGRDANLYRYAGGDPVNRADPTGLAACGAGACGATAGGSDALRPVPIGGSNRGGWTGGSGGGRRTGPSPHHDTGPKPPATPESPKYKYDGPSKFPTNDQGEVHRGDPGFWRPPSGGSVGGHKNSFTTCIIGCAREDRDGWSGSRGAPGGKDATCWGLCAPPIPGKNGYCIGFCSGGDREGNDGFVCFIACVYGEPHLVSTDGGRFEFQAAGEFVIARSGDDTFEVQARFQPSRVVRTVTMTTGLSLKVGPDRVALYRDPDTGDQSRTLVINGAVIDRARYATTLPGGGVVERLGADVSVTWPDGSRVFVRLYTKFMDFSIDPSDAIAGTLEGVIGHRDGVPENDLVIRGGAVLDPAGADFREQVHGVFADSWRIAAGESLFDYRKGETTETFQLRGFPTEHATVDGLDPKVRAEAEALCRAMGVATDPVLTTCIFDVGITGDASFAGSAAAAAASVERAGVTPLDIGTQVARNQQVSGSVTAGAVDRYHFTAAAGDIVYIDTDVACGPTVRWRLLRPNGTLTAFDLACVDLGRRVLDVAGEWRLEVYSDDGAAGPYGFRILSVPAPRESTIAAGGSANGSTTVPGEWHRYAFTATAGQVVYLDATGACDSPMHWRLLRPGGSLVAFETVCTDMGRRVLDAAGTWTIEVYADDLSTGAYAFRLIDAPATRLGTVAVGQTITDATGRIGEWHRYRLTAKAGDIVFLDALGACVSGLNWQLLRPDGSLVNFGTTCTDLGRRVLDVAGDWSVEVYSMGLEFGAYSFRVIGVPPVRVAPVTIGRQVTGTLGAIGEWHRYTIAATAGQRIVIDAQGDCVPDLWWRLLTPDGALTTFGNTCTDSDVRTLDVAGSWIVEIYSDVLATGPYAFTVKNAP